MDATTFDISSNDEFEEYAIVSKYPSTNGTVHFAFFSRHNIGVSATVDYFTDTEKMEHFIKDYLNDEQFFTVIFSAKGQDRTNTTLKLKTVVVF